MNKKAYLEIFNVYPRKDKYKAIDMLLDELQKQNRDSWFYADEECMKLKENEAMK